MASRTGEHAEPNSSRSIGGILHVGCMRCGAHMSVGRWAASMTYQCTTGGCR